MHFLEIGGALQFGTLDWEGWDDFETGPFFWSGDGGGVIISSSKTATTTSASGCLATADQLEDAPSDSSAFVSRWAFFFGWFVYHLYFLLTYFKIKLLA